MFQLLAIAKCHAISFVGCHARCILEPCIELVMYPIFFFFFWEDSQNCSYMNKLPLWDVVIDFFFFFECYVENYVSFSPLVTICHRCIRYCLLLSPLWHMFCSRSSLILIHNLDTFYPLTFSLWQRVAMDQKWHIIIILFISKSSNIKVG